MLNSKWPQRLWKLMRDLALIGIAVYAVNLWQSRNMLESDGSVLIQQQNLVSLSGETQPLLVENKRNLVYFFAPWCKVCAFSIGNLDALQADDLNVIRVALDYQSVQDIQAFVDANQVLGEVLLGTRDLQALFKIQGYPSYYLLDKNNRIVSKSIGYSSSIGLRATSYLNRS